MLDTLLAVTNTRNLYRSLFFMLVMLVVMNLAAAAFYQYTGGVSILDLAGGYMPETAYRMIAAYGEQGRRYHLLITAADTILPISVALFGTLAITYFSTHQTRSRAAVRGLLLLPAVYLAADYLENICIAAMLLSFPVAHPDVAALANTLLAVKNLSSGVMVVTILMGLGARLIQLQRGLRVGGRP